MLKAFLAILIIPLFLIISGCATFTQKNKDDAALEPQSILKFNDLPIPSGFQLIPKESYAFESSGLRVALLKYQGRAGADQVVNFYKDQMPLYNWKLLNIIEYGQRLLNFDREQESCIITLSSKGKYTVITLSLGPKSQYPVKKERSLK